MVDYVETTELLIMQRKMLYGNNIGVKNKTRYLYHSLMRLRIVGAPDIQHSLRTFELITSIELLAAPEFYMYSVLLPGGSTTEKALIQKRVSFTCLTF